MDAAVVGLIGVAIGGVFGFVGQAWTAHKFHDEQEAKREDQRRTERRLIVGEFLEEAQLLEEAVVVRADYGHRPEAASSAKLWYLQKYLGVVTTSELADASAEYARVLNSLLWDPLPGNAEICEGIIADKRKPFLHEAQLLLGSD